MSRLTKFVCHEVNIASNKLDASGAATVATVKVTLNRDSGERVACGLSGVAMTTAMAATRAAG